MVISFKKFITFLVYNSLLKIEIIKCEIHFLKSIFELSKFGILKKTKMDVNYFFIVELFLMSLIAQFY